jgi:hypothetical protein
MINEPMKTNHHYIVNKIEEQRREAKLSSQILKAA